MSNSATPIEHGYLVLADISGYTSFLMQTELDHAQEILSDLLETIVRRFQTLLTLHKLEGDAVFAYAPESRIVRGETLLEMIEAAYVDFRERLRNVRRHTTCTCRACQSIPMLDLKFMTHHGDYILQDVGGVREMAGSDVNLVHRLLKNHIAEETGWRAYALFTHQSLEHMHVQPEGVRESVESYEHLGSVPVCVMDLHARYDQLMQNRRVVVEPDQAILSFVEEIDASPPIVWSWLNDPEKRALFSADPHGQRFVAIVRPGGRTRAGAVTHCVHGKDIAMRERILDWKPFDYFTVEQDNRPMGLIQVTFTLEELTPDRTRLTARLNGGVPPLPAFIGRPFIHFIFTRLFDYRSVGVGLKKAIAAESAKASPEPPTRNAEAPV